MKIVFKRPAGAGAVKLLRIMKFVFLFLFIAFQAAAIGGHSQTVTLAERNAPLEKVFNSIEEQTGYVFFYNTEWLKKAKPVTIEVKNSSLDNVLSLCFKNQELNYSVVGKTIVLKLKNSSNKIQDYLVGEEGPPIDVKGRVVNEKGEPVTGATVSVKGSNRATSTNDNGEFVLKGIDANATLIITGVNIMTHEVRVTSNDVVVGVRTKLTTEEEVKVYTGYQQISKERFVGSAFVFDSSNFQKRIGLTIKDRMDGQIPGLLFNRKGGGYAVQLRGITTFTQNNEPSIVIDNFLFSGNLSDLDKILNPYDIESITVLKDAAAASVWGTISSNGVIVITTKKAKYNQPFHLSLTSNITLTEKPNLFYFPKLKTSDIIDVEQFLFNNGFYDYTLTAPGHPVISPVVEILAQQKDGIITATQANAQIDALRKVDIRNEIEKSIYRNAITSENYLNISGGNNLISYSISGGYNCNKQYIKDVKDNSSYSLSSNSTIKPLKNLEFSTTMSFLGTKTYGTFFGPPSYQYVSLADAQGNHLAIPFGYRQAYVDTVGGGKLLDWHYRPLDELSLADNVTNTQSINLNFSATYRFLSWLSGSISYGYSQQTSNNRNLYSQESYYTRDLINSYSQINSNGSVTRIIPLGGILDLANGKAINSNWRGQLNFAKVWGGKHSISALIAGDIHENKGELSNSRLYGYDKRTGSYVSTLNYNTFYPIFDQGYSNTIPQRLGYGEAVLNRFVGVLANASYSLSDRYTIYASARRDGANVFGVKTNNKWKPLWSTGVKWDISKERFYSLKWMPLIDIRASYGYTGNVNNTRSGLPSIIFSNPDQYTNFLTARPGDPPNPNLRWEKSKVVNLGVDFGIFNNRISGSFEWYLKKGIDLLSPVIMDPTSGVNSFTLNGGGIKVKGYEINLNTQNILGSLKWGTGFSLSYGKSIVTKYDVGVVYISDNIGYSFNPRVGQSPFGMASFKWAGLDPLTGDPQGYFNGQISKDYSSIFGDSLQNQVYHGSAIPLYQGYLSNSISWKDISLSAFITYKFDYYFRRPSIYYTDFYGGNGNSDYYVRWQKPGDEKWTTVPSMTYPFDTNRDAFYRYSEVNVLKGDHIRLQGINLQYNWVNKSFKRIPISNAQLHFYSNLNVILWRANKSNLDPDYTGGSNLLEAPPSRSWAAGVTISF